jgi:hypothetical protein
VELSEDGINDAKTYRSNVRHIPTQNDASVGVTNKLPLLPFCKELTVYVPNADFV